MPADINTDEYIDEGKVIASNLNGYQVLFVSDYDNRTYWVDECVVDYL